jgi:hypothetical protein
MQGGKSGQHRAMHQLMAGCFLFCHSELVEEWHDKKQERVPQKMTALRKQGKGEKVR